MSPDPVERKLAAILSADVVGYSRLMAEDETGTIRTLTAYREQIATLVREHRGRIVDSPGDNVLAEFPNALESVQAAVEIQRVIQARNADLPAERRMEFRIGIHLGDVMVEGERIYGDGVNIAARLEGLAKPGGVCISRTVYEQVERKVKVDLEDLGEQTLKNIERPVHVYGMKLVLPTTGPAEPHKALPGMDDLTVPGFRGHAAIAVLPFDNLSGDPEQDYFADGIAEDLLTRLSSWRDFPVIARNSSFVYKDQSVDVKRVSRELGVRYVVEGSIRKAGDQVRISVQLIDATTGAHVWADRYDRNLGDVFALQDEIANAIVASIHPELWKSEKERAARKDPRNLDAWDCLMRGMWHLNNVSKEENAEARALFQRAIELDPHLVRAYTGLAGTHYSDIYLQWTNSPSESAQEMERAAQKALVLDGKDPYAHLMSGYAYRFAGKRDKAIGAFQTAAQLNPSLSAAHYTLGITFALIGRADDAIASLDQAMRLSPHDPFMWLFLNGMALAHVAAERYEDAIQWAERSLQWRPDWPITHLVLAGSYAQLEQMDEARAAAQELLRLNPDFSLAGVRIFLAAADPAFIDRTMESLRKAGLKE
jgi:TolB-like protein/class 3 adenylate cyclase/tetratricopeptide (TPR) repeat protein